MTPAVTESLLLYVLSIWFVFFLLNHAAITAKPSAWLKQVLGPRWGYPLGCAFCAAFWATLFLWAVGFVPLWILFPAPVLHLLLDSVYDKLSGPPPLPRP